MSNYLQSILLSQEQPLEAKTLALKCYGANEDHLMSCLNSNSPALWFAAVSHPKFDENLLDSLEDSSNVLCEVFRKDPTLLSHENLPKYFELLYQLAEKEPEKAQMALQSIYQHPQFNQIDSTKFNLIKEMALSPLGSSLGIDRFFMDPEPQNGVDVNKSLDHYADAMEFLHGIGQFKPIKDTENDPRSTALQSFGYANSNSNRRVLDIVADLLEPKRTEPNYVTGDYIVSSKSPADENAAVIIDKSFRNRNVIKANFVGKHIGGALIASDPETGNNFLLKRADSKLSPALGVNEEKADQAQREFAFVQMAKHLGLDRFFPNVYVVYINGIEYSAIEIIGHEFEAAADLYDEDPNKVKEILEKHRLSGDLTRLAILDYILGNPDRHGHNILLNADGDQIVLIDHGSAFAGVSFAPGKDRNSFTPYYLRYRDLPNFPNNDYRGRFYAMPAPNKDIDDEIRLWIQSIDSDQFSAHLRAYGIMPYASCQRLQLLKLYVGPVAPYINSLWLK